MSRSIRHAAFGVLGLSALTLAACSAPVEASSESEAVSSAEPASITLYTSEPQEKADELVAAFNEIHPEITVEVFRAGTGDLTTRIAAEQEAGGIEADVLLAADAATFEDYAAQDLLLAYSPAEVDQLLPELHG